MEVKICMSHDAATAYVNRMSSNPNERTKGDEMHWKPMKLAALAILTLVLAATPVLMGCGEKEPTEKKVIVIGSLADFSGRAASAVVPTVDAFEEAIKYYQQQTPIEGVEFKFEQFDHQLNYSKAQQGYEELKAKGMNVFYCMGGTERDMLGTLFPADKMPTVGTYGTTKTLAVPWVYNVTPTQTWAVESAMKWIAETWDYGKGVPKIGHQGWDLATTDELQEGIDNAIQAPAYAGKFTWVVLDKANPTNTAWSASYEKLKTCDFIFVSTVGTSLGTFVAQMRSLGYTGSFVSVHNQFPGYFDNVQQAAQPAQLYGINYAWWGPIQGSDDPADWFQAMVATTRANHSDAATRLDSTGPITGWNCGVVVFNAIAEAVKDAGGADKLDGDAIKAGFDGLNLDEEGVGSTMKYSANNNSGLSSSKIVTWDVATGKWTDTNGVWYEPITLPE